MHRGVERRCFLLSACGNLVGTEHLSFLKDDQGNGIIFEGGIFTLDTSH